MRRKSNSDAYSDADTNTHADTNAYAHSYTNTHSDAYPDFKVPVAVLRRRRHNMQPCVPFRTLSQRPDSIQLRLLQWLFHSGMQ